MFDNPQGSKRSQRILVTGGAGYIGSHTVAQLCVSGYAVDVVDNLSTGNRWAVPHSVQLNDVDLLDYNALDNVFASQHYDAVVHLAALSLVGESMQRPLDYFYQNINMTLNLLKCMKRHHVKRIVFSSTANVYSSSARNPIDETAILAPGSPYGESKLAIERILQWADQLHGIHYAVLRYFNAAGADISGAIGECHDPETHLIPLVLQTALGNRDELVVFGDDYNTPDGTCIRDYVNVCDIASAHVLALDRIKKGSLTCNLGTGTGYSVQEIISAAERIGGHPIKYRMGSRRAGDPDKLIADPTKAMSKLGWNPQHSDLDTIITTAWNWHASHNGKAEYSKTTRCNCESPG